MPIYVACVRRSHRSQTWSFCLCVCKRFPISKKKPNIKPNTNQIKYKQFQIVWIQLRSNSSLDPTSHTPRSLHLTSPHLNVIHSYPIHTLHTPLNTLHTFQLFTLTHIHRGHPGSRTDTNQTYSHHPFITEYPPFSPQHFPQQDIAPKQTFSFNYGHTRQEAPDPVRSPKLSCRWPSQYCGGGPHGNTRCCSFLAIFCVHYVRRMSGHVLCWYGGDWCMRHRVFLLASAIPRQAPWHQSCATATLPISVNAPWMGFLAKFSFHHLLFIEIK